jgi:hypothetical protein
LRTNSPDIRRLDSLSAYGDNSARINDRDSSAENPYNIAPSGAQSINRVPVQAIAKHK